MYINWSVYAKQICYLPHVNYKYLKPNLREEYQDFSPKITKIKLFITDSRF